jgi:hypothetical protein
MGRTFAGDAFLAQPPLIEFRDFDVGRTVSASVQIINRSYRKNTFRYEHGAQPMCASALAQPASPQLT